MTERTQNIVHSAPATVKGKLGKLLSGYQKVAKDPPDLYKKAPTSFKDVLELHHLLDEERLDNSAAT